MPSEDVTEYKTGDVVRLLSGGPRMTVEGVGEVNAVCVWFTCSIGDDWTGPHRESFPVALLQQQRCESVSHTITYGSDFTDESPRQRAVKAKAVATKAKR